MDDFVITSNDYDLLEQRDIVKALFKRSNKKLSECIYENPLFLQPGDVFLLRH